MLRRALGLAVGGGAASAVASVQVFDGSPPPCYGEFAAWAGRKQQERDAEEQRQAPQRSYDEEHDDG